MRVKAQANRINPIQLDLEQLKTQLFSNDNLTVPIETILMDTNTLQTISDDILKNKPHCFSTDAGPYGWCATCKVKQISSKQVH